MSINNATLLGRLTTDPALKMTPNNTPYVTFNLAVSRPTSKEGQEHQTDFITCTAWRGIAEFIVKYFHKGETLAVVGAIQTHKYKDKEGNPRKYTEVRVREASFCRNKDKTIAVEQAESSPPKQEEYYADPPFAEPVADPPYADGDLEEDFYFGENLPC